MEESLISLDHVLISLRPGTDTVADSLTRDFMKWGGIPQESTRKNVGECAGHKKKKMTSNTSIITLSQSSLFPQLPVFQILFCWFPNVHLLPGPIFPGRPSLQNGTRQRQRPFNKQLHTWDFWGFLAPLIIPIWTSFLLVLLSLSSLMKKSVFMGKYYQGLYVWSHPLLTDSHFDWALIQAIKANGRIFKHKKYHGAGGPLASFPPHCVGGFFLYLRPGFLTGADCCPSQLEEASGAKRNQANITSFPNRQFLQLICSQAVKQS